LGAIGLGFLFRRGHRAEALAAGTIAIVYLLINSGYESPFGGNSPGPRFLVAVLPFLAVGFGAVFKRFPLTTAALASWRDALMAPLAVGGWIFVARRAPHLLEKSGHSWTVLGLAGAATLVVVLAPLLALLAPRARALGRSS
jgi:hypothetical protein